MPVKIRLARHGRKKKPVYFIVAADSRAPRDGRYIERIGKYVPTTEPATIDLDFDKALSWLQKGAQPTDTVRSILSTKGVLYKNHLLKGVRKEALTEEQAEEKFETWLNDKEQKLQAKKEKLVKDEELAAVKKLEQEEEVNKKRADEIAKRRAEAKAELKAEEEGDSEEDSDSNEEAAAEETAEAKEEEKKDE
ncbi:MAG: 30S ribosomal protein S16 [Bacteroidota bacterium]|nr:30S ribosomal protein S16 [Bacteroidota bacterium]